MKWKFAIIVMMSCLFVSMVKADNPIMACYDMNDINCSAPSIDIGEDGKVHICWRENRGDTGTFTCYRCYQPNGSPTPTYAPSLIMNVSNDAGLTRFNESRVGQVSHLAVDHGDDLATVVFYQRNQTRYWGTEQSALFAANDINPVFVTPTPTCTGTPKAPVYQKAVDHLESVGGMAEHMKDSFVLYHPTLEEIVVFWSQHQRMNDYDHDIYCNYRDVEDPAGAGANPITGWQYIVKASNTNNWDLEFWPSVAVNDSGVSGMDGEMYIVTEDYNVAKYTPTPTLTPTPGGPTPTPSATPTTSQPFDFSTPTPEYEKSVTDEDGALFFSRLFLTPTPQTTTALIDTTHGNKQHEAKRASVAYFYKENNDPPHEHQVVIAYTEVWHWSTNYYLQFTKIDLEPISPAWDDFNAYTPVSVNYAKHGGYKPVLDVDSTGLFRCVYIGSDNKIYEMNAEFDDDGWSTPQTLVSTTTEKQNVDFKIDPSDDDVFYIVYDEGINDEWRVYWERFTN